MDEELAQFDYWKVWEAKELERQFAPIVWISKEKDKRETWKNHLQISTDATKKARDTIPSELNVSYGAHENKKLDLYGTDLPDNAPTLFWVHGGYWRSGDRSWAAPFALNAYSWKVRTVVIDYPLAPSARLPEICNGGSESLSMVMKRFPNSIFTLGGHSAGAQIVLSLLHQIPGVIPIQEDLRARVAGVFLLSAPYDMRPCIFIPSINKALQLQSDEAINFSSALTLHLISPGFEHLKFLVGVGDHDPPALQKLAQEYFQILQRKFPNSTLRTFHEDHYSEIDSLVDNCSEITTTLKTFILNGSDLSHGHISKL